LKSANSVESILTQKKGLEAKVFSGEIVIMVNRHFYKTEIIIDKIAMFLRRFLILSEHCATNVPNKLTSHHKQHSTYSEELFYWKCRAIAHPSVVNLMCEMVNRGAPSHVLQVPEVSYWREFDRM